MRMLRRNKQKLWYANPTGTEYVTDENGFKTGEKRTTYTEPAEFRMSMNFVTMTGADGHRPSAVLDAQGIVTGYSWTALTDDMNCPITEESILWYRQEPWVEAEPEETEETEPEGTEEPATGEPGTGETEPEGTEEPGTNGGDGADDTDGADVDGDGDGDDDGGDGDDPEPEPEPAKVLRPYDLMVVRIVRSLNSVMYYLKEADVS